MAKRKNVAQKQGLKFDRDKIPYQLLSIPAMRQRAYVLKYGAQKYSERNWEEGLEYSRLYRAALGHLIDFFSGIDRDNESGCLHLAHAACCIDFLLHYESDRSRYEGFDDRPVRRQTRNSNRVEIAKKARLLDSNKSRGRVK